MPNGNRLERSFAWLTALALLNLSLTGCTVAGASIGAGIDSLIPGPYEKRPATEFVRLERDEDVLVLLRNGTRVTGQYVGTHGPTAADLDRYLLVRTDEQLVTVEVSEVSSIAVEVTGKGWLYGGLIGFAADAAIVMATVVALHNLQTEPLTGSGCFC